MTAAEWIAAVQADPAPHEIEFNRASGTVTFLATTEVELKAAFRRAADLPWTDFPLRLSRPDVARWVLVVPVDAAWLAEAIVFATAHTARLVRP